MDSLLLMKFEGIHSTALVDVGGEYLGIKLGLNAVVKAWRYLEVQVL
jgi:hypothetical protein